ncbi:hypothetical protein N5P37_010428, partial [Trichoderma harzianum]
IHPSGFPFVIHLERARRDTPRTYLLPLGRRHCFERPLGFIQELSAALWTTLLLSIHSTATGPGIVANGYTIAISKGSLSPSPLIFLDGIILNEVVDGAGSSSKNVEMVIASQHVSLRTGPSTREPTASILLGPNDDLWDRILLSWGLTGLSLAVIHNQYLLECLRDVRYRLHINSEA